jgi:hypothetical protein
MVSLGASLNPSAILAGFPKTAKIELTVTLKDSEDENYLLEPGTSFASDLIREIHETLLLEISDVKVSPL